MVRLRGQATKCTQVQDRVPSYAPGLDGLTEDGPGPETHAYDDDDDDMMTTWTPLPTLTFPVSNKDNMDHSHASWLS